MCYLYMSKLITNEKLNNYNASLITISRQTNKQMKKQINKESTDLQMHWSSDPDCQCCSPVLPSSECADSYQQRVDHLGCCLSHCMCHRWCHPPLLCQCETGRSSWCRHQSLTWSDVMSYHEVPAAGCKFPASGILPAAAGYHMKSVTWLSSGTRKCTGF